MNTPDSEVIPGDDFGASLLLRWRQDITSKKLANETIF